MRRLLFLTQAWISWWRPRHKLLFPARQFVAVVATVPVLLLIVPMLVLYVRLFGPVDVEERLEDGIKIRCRLPDAVQLYLFLFGVWEPDISAWMRQRLTTADTFVDVGSHVGYYALLASQQVGPHGRVVAIEASPRIFQQLQGNLALNGVSNVRAVNIAAAEAPGSVKIYCGPPWNLGWTTTLASRKLPQECEVAALTLDEILSEEEQQRVRLIKIDVEGSERSLFASLIRIARKSQSNVNFLVELSPRWWCDSSTVDQALQAFRDEGFHVYRVDNDYGPWRYLTSDIVRPPQRVTGPIKTWLGQVDLVLSRDDREWLE